MKFLVSPRRRRSLRRSVELHCQAVLLDEFRLLGEQLFDVSPRGLLAACNVPVELGQSVMVSFAITPGRTIDAEAEVARVLHGFRTNDQGKRAGLRFTYLERACRHELLANLAGVPPVIPARRPPIDYAETVQRIAAAA